MGETRNANRISVGRFERAKPLERLRSMRENNIKMYLKEEIVSL